MRSWTRSRVWVEGFHRWPQAPDICPYLRDRHRHIFGVTVRVASNAPRENEFIEVGRLVKAWLHAKFGDPCEFGELSCEEIARAALNRFEWLDQVVVSEDDENDAVAERD